MFQTGVSEHAVACFLSCLLLFSSLFFYSFGAGKNYLEQKKFEINTSSHMLSNNSRAITNRIIAVHAHTHKTRLGKDRGKPFIWPMLSISFVINIRYWMPDSRAMPAVILHTAVELLHNNLSALVRKIVEGLHNSFGFPVEYIRGPYWRTHWLPDRVGSTTVSTKLLTRSWIAGLLDQAYIYIHI